MSTQYVVVSSDGRTSLTQAIRDVEGEVQSLLDKGGKLQGGISVSGWYEEGLVRYGAAQAVLMEK